LARFFGGQAVEVIVSGKGIRVIAALISRAAKVSRFSAAGKAESRR
jgi:hypothetical protein